jgi:hypothetical protein
MPLTFEERNDGRSYPIIRCDWCGRQIDDVVKGNVYWYEHGDNEPDALYFNHKECAWDHDGTTKFA